MEREIERANGLRPVADGYIEPPAEAESSLLAAMLLDRQVIDQVRRLVRPEAFHRVPHQLMFRALVSLYEAGGPVDTVTLCDELRRRNDLDAVGGYVFVSQIMEYATTAANAAVHARIVREAHAKREILRLGLDIQAQAEDSSATSTTLLAELRFEKDDGATPNGKHEQPTSGARPTQASRAFETCRRRDRRAQLRAPTLAALDTQFARVTLRRCPPASTTPISG